MTVDDSDRYFCIRVKDRNVSLQFLPSFCAFKPQISIVSDIFITPLLIKFYFVSFDTIILILFLLISITYDSMLIQYLLSIKLKNILEQ